jgi:PAS domain S-box-containing protein
MLETQVEHQNELYALLVSRLDEFVVVLLSKDGHFLTWNPGVKAHFGYSADEFIGQHVELLLPRAERGRGEAERELRRAVEDGRASDTRMFESHTGAEILAEGVTLALHNSEGELVGFGKILRNVTENKTIEENLRALARALDQSTVIVRQLDGTIEHWTAGCEHLYGWTAAEAVGKPAHKLLRTVFPGDLERMQSQLQTWGTWKGELEQCRRDGSLVYVSTYWMLLSDGAADPVTVIETHSDITARVQIQKELEGVNQRLKRMALELERSNQDLEEFARIASHDLSAPITSTRWLVDLLASRHGGQLDESGKKIVTQITQGLDRMSDLVDAVLAHARVGTSAIGNAEAVPAADSLAASIQNLQRHITLAGAVVEHGPLPQVEIDPQALTQLFQNLISNSIKYRKPEAAPHIAVDAKPIDSMWQFSVSDNGIGIEQEWHERIFQPMQRRHGLNVAGSGIGLATCKKIVTRAGGRIWVESKPGEGAVFLFTLPGPPPPQ